MNIIENYIRPGLTCRYLRTPDLVLAEHFLEKTEFPHLACLMDDTGIFMILVDEAWIETEDKGVAFPLFICDWNNVTDLEKELLMTGDDDSALSVIQSILGLGQNLTLN